MITTPDREPANRSLVRRQPHPSDLRKHTADSHAHTGTSVTPMLVPPREHGHSHRPEVDATEESNARSRSPEAHDHDGFENAAAFLGTNPARSAQFEQDQRLGSYTYNWRVRCVVVLALCQGNGRRTECSLTEGLLWPSPPDTHCSRVYPALKKNRLASERVCLNKRMATPGWRSFEQLISRIEHALAGGAVTVKSPDFIPCLTTGTSREVDVSLRSRVGSADILVTVECRDRVAVQDVIWIEQLAAKKKNIGAAKTVAVATSGFSAEATRIARENAIDLRVLHEITDDEIKTWMPLLGMVHVFKECDLTGPAEIVFFAERDDGPEEITKAQAAGSVSPTAQQIFRGPNGEMLSLNDIWPSCG
jgi:hypothetical protein